MPRTTYAHEGQEAPEATPVYQNLKKGFGMVPNVVKLLGHSGPATQALGALLDVSFNKLPLTPRVREIAYLTVTHANHCDYCKGHHVPLAKAAGLTDAQIALLGPQGFDNLHIGLTTPCPQPRPGRHGCLLARREDFPAFTA